MNHKLKIETGWFSSKNQYQYVPPENRICENCFMSRIEGEVHFLIECPLYEVHTKHLCNSIMNVNSHFEGYTPFIPKIPMDNGQ